MKPRSSGNGISGPRPGDLTIGKSDPARGNTTTQYSSRPPTGVDYNPRNKKLGPRVEGYYTDLVTDYALDWLKETKRR